MKRFLSVIVLISLFIGNVNLLKAEDLLPSEAYYKEHIAVNEISAESPSLRAPGGNNGYNPGGPGSGTGGGGHMGAPIGDALLPLLAAGLFYGIIVLYRNRKPSVK
ncbi:MAG TPA: hypothetical protein DIT04_11205 [Dysgonomonas sp.]|nr:hypothetical protein [Dysgonomonas sp.]